MSIFSRKPKGSGMTRFEENFWALFGESLKFKDRCALKSAYRKRIEACEMAQGNTEGYEGMGYHNLAVLEMYHLGKGVDAGVHARKSLEDANYYLLSEKRKKMHLDLFEAHLESLQMAIMTSTSYAEAADYLAEGLKLYGEKPFTGWEKNLKEFRDGGSRFVEYQMMLTSMFYSRVSQEEDKGNYPPGIAILEVILENAENPDYDLSYEEYVSVLDDYAMITGMMLFNKAKTLGGRPDDFINELAWLTEKPIKKIVEFFPDCQPSDREHFQQILQLFKTFPGVVV